MRYQKFPPFKDLKPFIECYFVWEGEAAEQMEVQSPPNCFCAMVFKTYYLFGSYVMFISEDIRFKPSLLLRASSGSPLSADLNAMFTFRELYTGGIFTRNFNS